MPIDIEFECLRIGEDTDHNVVLGLDPLKRLQAQLVEVDTNKSFLSLPIIPYSNEDYFQRLSTVLEIALTGHEVDWQSAPVLILLPEQEGLDDEYYQRLFSNLCQAAPALTFHSECYLFPYGNNALIFAWRHLEHLLHEQKAPYVWILAIDSDPRLSQRLPVNEQNNDAWLPSGIAAESVILVKVSISGSGLIRNWFTHEVQNKDIAKNNVIESVFERYSKEYAKGVQQFYAPYNGNSERVKEWANAYHLLYPFVGTRTQVVMTGAVTGELGACSGLYNLLHLYTRYQRGDYLHSTLQLEISKKQYRGAASYAWHQ